MKRADFVEPTEHSVICNIHFSPNCYEKSFMVEMGLRKQSPLLSGAVLMIQSPAATNSCDKRKQPIQNEGSEQPEMADSANKRPRRSRALQKLEVNRVSSQPLYLLFFATQIISASFEKPCKETAVEQYVSRFAHHSVTGKVITANHVCVFVYVKPIAASAVTYFQ